MVVISRLQGAGPVHRPWVLFVLQDNWVEVSRAFTPEAVVSRWKEVSTRYPTCFKAARAVNEVSGEEIILEEVPDEL